MLDNRALKTLKLANKRGGVFVDDISPITQNFEVAQEILDSLCSKSYLKKCVAIDKVDPFIRGLTPDTLPNKEHLVYEYKILPDGIAHIQYELRKNIIEWVRYSITTLIAVAALINSVLARLGL